MIESTHNAEPFPSEVDNRDMYWKRLYRWGYRVEKVTVITEFCDGAGEIIGGIKDMHGINMTMWRE
jgi:hypothetical protein